MQRSLRFTFPKPRPPLTWRKYVALLLHLAICPHCRRYHKQPQFIRQHLQQWRNHS